ncbi:unnamed protein product [Polarella glacialis]|uniref:Uncharacterized protein n=1 Tax=Polarella glacialis TaxID=89957 RepID=A0A813GCT4_POLGL|nr:unnamed protein product [Polarella glacialis]
MSICAWTAGMSPPPTGIFDYPRFDTAFRVDFSAWAPGSPKLPCMIVGSLVLLFVALFDLAGVQYGLMGIAGLLKNGTVPRSTSIFTSAAVGTMVGALLGTSPVIIANESSAGIIEGARTGLAAVTVSVLFFVSAFLAPLLGSIPHVATAVPLVLIGAFMMAPCRGIDWDDLRAAIPSFLTITVVPFTYSIHNGIIAGILMDFFLGLTAAKDEVKAGAFSPGGSSRSSRQPLLGDKRNKFMSPAIMEKLSTPHTSMASLSKDVDKALLGKAEKARQLMVELRFAMATSGPPTHGQAMDESQRRVRRRTEEDGAASDEALLKALEAYLGGQPTAIGID